MSSQRDATTWSPLTHTLIEFYIHTLARTPNPPPIRTLNTLYRHRLQKLAVKGDESERKIASGQLANWRVCVGVFGWVFATTINTCVCVLRRPAKEQEQFIENEQESLPPLLPKSKAHSKPTFATSKTSG